MRMLVCGILRVNRVYVFKFVAKTGVLLSKFDNDFGVWCQVRSQSGRLQNILWLRLTVPVVYSLATKPRTVI